MNYLTISDLSDKVEQEIPTVSKQCNSMYAIVQSWYI